MNLTDVIANRRSVRSYTPQKVEKEKIEELLHAAVQAPSASNSQPWAFAVIQDTALLREYSERAKKFLLDSLEVNPGVAKYRGMLMNADFNIFYTAGTLVVIFAKPGGLHSHGDCCLAAQNLMLAAHGLGLGTCWIGFATAFLDQAAVKRELGVPEEYAAVAPLLVGYPHGRAPQLSRDKAEVLVWKG